MSNLVGTIVAKRYRIDALVGHGGMADVYRGVDSLLGRPVAIKIFTDRAVSVRKRYLREAQSMARLNHRNVVAVYDAGEVNDLAFIIMELVEGETLRDLIGTRKLPLDKAVAYIVELLEAMRYAHAQSVVHCDIKPANIMITPDGTVKVMDFGLSRRVSDYADNAAPGEITGTVAYLSPERFLGKPVDQRSDLYSVGIVMYELFTGTVPFDSEKEDLVAIIFSHVNEAPLSPRVHNPRLPIGLERIIMKTLEKDPAKRFASAAELIEELRPFAQPGNPLDQAAAYNGFHGRGAPPVETQVADMLDGTFGSSRRSNEASSNILAGMIAARRSEYDDAGRHFLAAMTALKTGVDSGLEFAKTALKYAQLTLTKNSASPKPDRGEIGVAIASLQEALPILRGARLLQELEEGERTLYALNRLDVSTRV